MKIKYQGKETHKIVETKLGYIKFKNDEPKEVSDEIGAEILKLDDFSVSEVARAVVDKIESGKILPSLRRRKKE